MPMFRKRPIVVEARRFENVDSGSVIATWCGASNQANPEAIEIPTLEGTMRASLGDWIIRGVHGEFYPCKPDIFDLTYEMV
jgi:hypothetical protein